MIQQLEDLQKLTAPTAPTAANTAELERIKKLNEKLKTQKKKEEEYMKEKKRREEDLLSIEKNYQDLNEEVEAMRSRFIEVKKKYIGGLTDLRDIQMEHENEKEDLLDSIRYQQS